METSVDSSEVVVKYCDTLRKYEGCTFVVNRGHVVVVNGKEVRK